MLGIIGSHVRTCGMWKKVLTNHKAPIMGEDCELEPSVFIYSLKNENESKYVGTNFGLPHRDFSFTQSTYPDGSPKILSLWMPLTDATLDNGCMFVIPKEHDKYFDKPDAYEHLRCATVDKEGNFTRVRFDVATARALPAKQGSVLGWHGGLIHWGGKANSKADVPRISLTGTIRKKGEKRTHLEVLDVPSIPRKRIRSLTLNERIQIIAHTLLVYKVRFR